jgi:general secretion pathway protein F
MPTYLLKVVDRQGQRFELKRKAEDLNSLKESLRKEGLIPLSIKRQKPGLMGFKRISSKDVLVFTEELANLLEAGLSIDRALYILARHTEKEPLKEVIEALQRDIQRGRSLSEAMAVHSCFPKVYVNMVRAAEAGGFLEPVLRRIASFLETTSRFKEDVLSALVYPTVLLFVAIVAVTVLMVYVVPKFTSIFEEMGESLPVSTEVLITVSAIIGRLWWIGLIIFVLAIVMFIRYRNTAQGKMMTDRWLLRLPLVGTLQKKIFISRFSRTLGTLLKSGVPVLTAIRISRQVVGNEVITSSLAIVEEGVRHGRGLYQPMREVDVFPEMVVEMIGVAEEAGRVEEALLQIADRYEEETRRTIRRVLSILEPALILVMGLVVGFIILSMLVAIFSISELPI